MSKLYIVGVDALNDLKKQVGHQVDREDEFGRRVWGKLFKNSFAFMNSTPLILKRRQGVIRALAMNKVSRKFSVYIEEIGLVTSTIS